LIFWIRLRRRKCSEKKARKPRMSLEQVNVERKLGRGQVVSLAHESKLHVVTLAILLTAPPGLNAPF
jgi:hypothetical protein